MRVPLSWLAEYVDVGLTPEALAERLTLLGMEVKSVERTEKMGVVSNGMLCSGDELELTGDADGILILPADTPLGAALADLYGDVVLDVDVKPNRGDALSMVPLAPHVAAITRAAVHLPDT